MAYNGRVWYLAFVFRSFRGAVKLFCRGKVVIFVSPSKRVSMLFALITAVLMLST